MDKAEIESRVRKVLAEQLAVDEAQVVPRRPFRRGSERGLARPRRGGTRPRGGVEYRHPRGRDGRGQDRWTGRGPGRAEARIVLTPMGERVVVAGIGPVTPVGTGVDDFWARRTSGRSGIRLITAFETDDLPVKVAGEVGVRSVAVAGPEVRRTDPFVHWRLVGRLAWRTPAAGGAVRARGCHLRHRHRRHPDPARRAPRAARGPGRVSPFMVPALMANAASGHIAMRFGFTGPNLCTVSACSSSNHAIGEALRYIRDGYVASVSPAVRRAQSPPLRSPRSRR